MTQAPMPPGPPGPFASQVPQRGKGMAKAALVLGILSFIPFCGLVGVILAVVVLATGRPGKGMAIAGLILPLIIIPLLLFGMVMPKLGPSQDLAKRSICGANLNGIGKQILIYRAEHEQMPPNVGTIISQGLPPQILKCPSAKGGRPSDYFLYFPTEEPDVGSALIGCDYRGNHGKDGRNVLTYDGSVRFIRGEAAFQAELAKPENAKFAKALRKAEGG